MNNFEASEIRNVAISEVFNGNVNFDDIIQKDTGVFLYEVNYNGEPRFVEIKFSAKKSDYDINYDLKKFEEKQEKAINAEKEKRSKKKLKENSASKTE